MTGVRRRASASSSARNASSVSRLTRQTPFLPILSAGKSPDRMSVYTWVTVTFSTRATSAGFSNGAGRSSAVMTFASLGAEIGQLGVVASQIVPALAVRAGRNFGDGR